MTVCNILQYPDDEQALRKKSEKVPKVDDPIRDLIQNLKDSLTASPRAGAGLAAPQIGVHKRVIVVKFYSENQTEEDEGEEETKPERPIIGLINPVILKTGKEAKGYDGCLSIPNLVTWETPRPLWLTFRAMDENGKIFERRVSDMNARLIHHEVDHLDGVLFIDRIKDISDLLFVEQTKKGERYVRIR